MLYRRRRRRRKDGRGRAFALSTRPLRRSSSCAASPARRPAKVESVSIELRGARAQVESERAGRLCGARRGPGRGGQERTLREEACRVSAGDLRRG